MRYAGIIYNDFSAAPGVSLTFFAQGCAHHCAHCHNQETWDFDKGLEFTEDIPDKIVEGLLSNGIKRTFCIMGGEPLHPKNIELTNNILNRSNWYYLWIKKNDHIISIREEIIIGNWILIPY